MKRSAIIKIVLLVASFAVLNNISTLLVEDRLRLKQGYEVVFKIHKMAIGSKHAIHHQVKSGDNSSKLSSVLPVSAFSTVADMHTENTTLSSTRLRELEDCSRRPSSLLENIPVVECKDVRTAELRNPEVKVGGEWSPPDCKALQKLAIIVSYRDRESHLIQMLAHLHPFLQRQKLHYRIFVIEQTGNEYFNKGALYNTGFMFANKTFHMDCVSFHDVDLLPIDNRNMYTCSPLPRHLSVAIDVFNFKKNYDTLIGGVLNLTPEHVRVLNGYSNLFWGWGAEDDDLWWRFVHHNMTVDRPPIKIARYIMLQHKSRRKTDKGWAARYNLSRAQMRKDRSNSEGLSSVNTTILSVREHKLYTHIMVDVGHQPPIEENVTPVD